MGTITRSFANNITTSGVLLPASLTNNSIANVTAYNAAIATGNMVLISSQTASNSASISFTTGINSTYKEYQFWFIDIDPSVDSSQLRFNLSTDGGSNYNVTKTSVGWYTYHSEDGSASGLEYNTAADLAQETGDQSLMRDLGTDADQNGVAILQLFNPSSTTYVKHFIGDSSVYHNDNYAISHKSAGYANTTSAINAVIFRCTSGNFSGTILMYGIV